MENAILCDAKIMKCEVGHYSIFCDEIWLEVGKKIQQFDLDMIIECDNCGDEICPQCDYENCCSQECLDEYNNINDCNGCWEPKIYCICEE